MSNLCPYDITQVQFDDDNVVEETGGVRAWQALQSAIQTNVKYEFISDSPYEYFDFKDRYLIRRVKANRDDSELLLAYCFSITLGHDNDLPIPSALIEDIIADVELMKG